MAICLPHHPTHTATSLWSCCGASHQHCFCALIFPPVITVPFLFRLRDGGASCHLYYAVYIIIFTCYYHGASHHLLYSLSLVREWRCFPPSLFVYLHFLYSYHLTSASMRRNRCWMGFCCVWHTPLLMLCVSLWLTSGDVASNIHSLGVICMRWVIIVWQCLCHCKAKHIRPIRHACQLCVKGSGPSNTASSYTLAATE